MDFLFTSTIAILAEAIVTAIVIFTLYSGYAKGKTYFRLVFTAVFLDIAYLIFFLISRYGSGHITEEVNEEAYYVLLASSHGIVSLAAVIYTIVFFFKAKKAHAQGENYFKNHPKQSVLVGVLWIVSLLSGLVL